MGVVSAEDIRTCEKQGTRSLLVHGCLTRRQNMASHDVALNAKWERSR